MSTWYIGPLGDMRALVCPEPGISVRDVRYGGIHQGLSGARTMDVTGHRSEFQFEFTYLDQDEWAWLDALHTRLVPGPHRLINPLKKNRLTLRASNMDATSRRAKRDGVYTPAMWEKTTEYPAGMFGRSVKMLAWSTAVGYLAMDIDKPVPVLPGEALSASVWLRSEGTHTGAKIHFDGTDRYGQRFSDATFNLPDLTTEWQRFTVPAYAPPANAAGVTMFVQLGADDSFPVYVAAPQLETGPVVTGWEIGGGAPEVLMDQLESTSPRFPLRDATLTLLEA